METIHEILTHLQHPTRFYFLRHGESAGNVEGKMQGHRDRHLTERGREQARKTAAWFAENGITFDHIYSSPLIRAAETAREVLDQQPGDTASIEYLESVKELYTGMFTGLSFDEIKARYPREYAQFIVGSWEAVPEAEPVASLAQRGLDTWRTLVERANGIAAERAHGAGEGAPGAGEPPHGAAERGHGAGEPVAPPPSAPPTILTVTHGGILQWILKVSFGATPENPAPWMPLILASNCAVFAFTARPVQGVDENGDSVDWYYGQWSMMNYTPTGDGGSQAVMREQFHTTAGDAAR